MLMIRFSITPPIIKKKENETKKTADTDNSTYHKGIQEGNSDGDSDYWDRVDC
jgi:hypothetical protein